MLARGKVFKCYLNRNLLRTLWRQIRLVKLRAIQRIKTVSAICETQVKLAGSQQRCESTVFLFFIIFALFRFETGRHKFFPKIQKPPQSSKRGEGRNERISTLRTHKYKTSEYEISSLRRAGSWFLCTPDIKPWIVVNITPPESQLKKTKT